MTKSQTAPRMSLRKIGILVGYYWLIPLTLVTVAVRQIVLTQFAGLSAWHGGGFGMFASIDRDEYRVIEVWAEDDQGQQIRVDLSPVPMVLSERELALIRTIPTRDRLALFADQLLDVPLTTLDESGTVYRVAQSSEEDLPALTIESISVQVFRLEYERQSQELRYIPVGPFVKVLR